MKAKYLLVLGMFVLLSSKLAFAQSYCGNALRIDFLKCEYVNTGTSQYCKRSYTVGQSVSCTGNPNDCFTVGSVCGSSDECTLQGNTCVKACGRKQCWVNPGDDPPPPPPPSGGSLCGASCTSSSQCGGLTCAVGGVCYGPVCDTGTTPANHRVRVKVFDCNNNLRCKSFSLG